MTVTSIPAYQMIACLPRVPGSLSLELTTTGRRKVYCRVFFRLFSVLHASFAGQLLHVHALRRKKYPEPYISTTPQVISD